MEHKESLGQAAMQFLASLPDENRAASQQEVYQFIRWYGWDRACQELTIPEVANYAERMASPTIDLIKKLEPVRAFLTYVRKSGLIKTNMATHLRAKKKPTKYTVVSSKPSAESIPLTAQGYAELQTELETLKSQRPYMSEEIHRAAADKDFRENAPLEAAREAQGQLEGRIRGLESILGAATVSEQEMADIHQLALGNTVVLQDLISNEELRYKLVSSSEVNLAKGKISVASPTGKALLGQKEGEIIEVIAPAGVWRYRIARIER